MDNMFFWMQFEISRKVENALQNFDKLEIDARVSNDVTLGITLEDDERRTLRIVLVSNKK